MKMASFVVRSACAGHRASEIGQIVAGGVLSHGREHVTLLISKNLFFIFKLGTLMMKLTNHGRQCLTMRKGACGATNTIDWIFAYAN